jgi:hypothetical protein
VCASSADLIGGNEREVGNREQKNKKRRERERREKHKEQGRTRGVFLSSFRL